MSCLFCDLAHNPEARKNPEDQVLAESQFFYVKPALGHFACGYLLINAKDHLRSLAYLSTEALAELNVVKNIFRLRIESLLDCDVILFEHGEVNPNHHPGCCLEHAHLHLLPLPKSVSDIINLSFPKSEIASLAELQPYAANNISYLFYEDRQGTMHVYHIAENLPSQFLRQEFSRRLGKHEQWDWAVFPFREEIIRFSDLYERKAQAKNWNFSLCGLQQLGSTV